jgi:hypothetical protein
MRDQTELISELTRFDGSRLNNKDNLLDMLEMLVRKLDPAEAKTKTLKDYTDADIAAVVAETRRKEELDIFPEQGPAEFDDVFLEAM